MLRKYSTEAGPLLLVERVPPADVDALIRKRGADDVAEASGVPVGQLGDARREGPEHLARRQAICGTHLKTHVRAALEPGDAHHEELVEIAREDRQVLDALEQGLGVVLGECEHPLVEGKPGQLAVAEAVLRQVTRLVGVGHEVALRNRVC